MELKIFNDKINRFHTFDSGEAEKIFIQNKIDNQELLSAASKYHNKFFNKQIKFFYPGEKFVSISLTDQFCELDCLHCNKTYLKQMLSISKYNSLIDLALELEKKGIKGLLISGGCDKEGRVPIQKYIALYYLNNQD